MFTKDGYETEFAVNHLDHFYLTSVLTGKLGANETPSYIVIAVTSGNSQLLSSRGIDFSGLMQKKLIAYLLTIVSQNHATFLKKPMKTV